MQFPDQCHLLYQQRHRCQLSGLTWDMLNQTSWATGLLQSGFQPPHTHSDRRTTGLHLWGESHFKIPSNWCPQKRNSTSMMRTHGWIGSGTFKFSFCISFLIPIPNPSAPNALTLHQVRVMARVWLVSSAGGEGSTWHTDSLYWVLKAFDPGVQNPGNTFNLLLSLNTEAPNK